MQPAGAAPSGGEGFLVLAAVICAPRGACLHSLLYPSQRMLVMCTGMLGLPHLQTHAIEVVVFFSIHLMRRGVVQNGEKLGLALDMVSAATAEDFAPRWRR